MSGLVNKHGRPLSSGGSSEKKPGFIKSVATWIVKVIAFIPLFLASLMEHFAEPGGAGAVLLGSLVFCVGVIMSADGYWQMLGGKALLPFFEYTWLGWHWLPGITFFPPRIWLGILVNPIFWVAIFFSFTTQVLQSFFFNGDVKAISSRSGLNAKTVGLVALITFSIEIVLTFATRNPLRYDDPSMVLGCLLYDCTSVVSAECGYTVYKMLKG
ncbi:MAG: hypothetical protein V7L23_13165 [Nostoc sp.]